ncbi:DUF3999 family protein [Granulicella rosea]|uniref:DUF3999 family protein n=1 Tax=Granulicella rosea TaxID=474952 RepID=UPI000B791210|nr:DUF3999 family protein [Granulicella rosea]
MLLTPIAFAQSKPAAPAAEPRYFRYESPVKIAPGAGPAACALLTPQVFAHAAPSLTDLRLYAAGQEVPYAETLSQASAPGSESARVLNLGMRGGHVVFDLEMPERPYTEVDLDLDAKDFLATAKVSGSAAPAGPATELGEFTLFDLTGQRLSRSTTIALQESTFRYLHVELTMTPAAGASLPVTAAMVQGAEIPPSREAQTLYTEIASAAPSVGPSAGQEEVATFRLPAHVPVERVRFVLEPGFKANFSRAVRVSARPDGVPDAGRRPVEEELAGEISRVDMVRAGRPIHELQLTVPATLGANMQTGASVVVAVEDGNDRPLQIASVMLEMRERKLCFDAPAEPPALFYGDPGLRAPVYDYARFFTPTAAVRVATLGPEIANPLYAPRPDDRPFTDRHPDLLWVALVVAVGVLAMVAFRSGRQMGAQG